MLNPHSTLRAKNTASVARSACSGTRARRTSANSPFHCSPMLRSLDLARSLVNTSSRSKRALAHKQAAHTGGTWLCLGEGVHSGLR
jgi:hypothetical protein